MSKKIVIDLEKIPDQIKIGGRIVKIVYPYQFKERSDLKGQVHYSLGTIFIAKDDCDGDEYPLEAIFETLLHEILHYVCHIYNGEKQLNEEEVCALANGLYQVLVDNFKEEME
jgi:hypothetical protein